MYELTVSAGLAATNQPKMNVTNPINTHAHTGTQALFKGRQQKKNLFSLAAVVAGPGFDAVAATASVELRKLALSQ